MYVKQQAKRTARKEFEDKKLHTQKPNILEIMIEAQKNT